MRRSEDFRKFAAISLAIAKSKQDREERVFLLEMAARWHELAEFFEEAENWPSEFWPLAQRYDFDPDRRH